ncbi:ROK family protein [Streptomyces sp. NPDC056716]|uniref:ROK family protein n=1 Tax=unclassified Streptomyces TaxID=2593676 RepID=UPI0036B98817
MFAGIAGSGRDFRCAIGTGPEDVRAEAVFDTTTPDETLGRVTGFLRAEQERYGPVTAVGIGCFGPLDLRLESATYGRVGSVLKPGWPGFDLVGAVWREFPVPIALDTDVNAGALAEREAGGGGGDLVFVIVTGGIGAGVLTGKRVVHGRAHPELGHLPVARHPSDDLPGHCPYHPDCLESLASRRALVARTGAEGWPGAVAEDWPGAVAEEVVELEAWYLAQLTTALTYAVSPERIVFDGDVMTLPGLLPALREATVRRLGDDPAVAGVREGMDTYVVRSTLEGRAVLRGALLLASHVAPPPNK